MATRAGFEPPISTVTGCQPRSHLIPPGARSPILWGDLGVLALRRPGWTHPVPLNMAPKWPQLRRAPVTVS